uniref:CCHC-type domain-containing protein n=1 Tax=Cannabis sativa TaxID=3483 RepID=A0A803NTB8_CANSA
MELVGNSGSVVGKNMSHDEATLTLTPCDSTVKNLTNLCLFGKVLSHGHVKESFIIDLVKNVWKRPARVVPVLATTINNNCFELIFEKVDDRNWALLRSPWNIRGKLLLLKSWEPSVQNGSPFIHTRLWVQIHKLPVEFFSVSNGNKLGTRVGNVVVMDLDEENPASWAKWLRVLVEIDIEKPLLSGCFINVGDEANVWVQFKYEKVGAFCYFCGRLGHQRSECTLSAPNTVSNVHGRSFPLYGPWLNTDSLYLDCFAGKSKNFSAPKTDSSSSARGLRLRQCAPPLIADPAVGKEVVAGASSSAVALRKTKTTSRGPRLVHHHGADVVWVPKVVDGVNEKAGSGERASFVAVSGNEVGVNLNIRGKLSESFPCLETSKLVVTPGEPLVNGGLCTNVVTLEGGPSNDKSHLGLGVGGPGRDVHLSERLELISNVGIGSEGVLVGGPGRGKELDLKWTDGSIILVRPTITMDLIGEESFDGNVGPRGNGSELVDLVNKNNTHEIFASCAVNQDDEERALSHFLKAQEELLFDLKHFGKLDLYEIMKIGGDIGVKPSSETNERTTPFKKRKFEGSASLCTRPKKSLDVARMLLETFPGHL